MKTLLEANAQVDMQGEGGRTALMYAIFYAFYGNPYSRNVTMDTMKTLIQANAQVDMQEKTGMTALMMAASRGSVNELKILLEANAQVNMQDQWGKTALMYAARDGGRCAVDVLVRVAGSDRSIRDKSGKSALDWVSGDWRQEITEILQEDTADAQV